MANPTWFDGKSVNEVEFCRALRGFRGIRTNYVSSVV